MITAEHDALLATKLGGHAGVRRHVDRGRLRALLESTPDARLVLVSAPAGFGKSTLLADWLQTADVRAAWLSLDAGDNDLVRFARYLAAAADRLAGRARDGQDLDPARPFDPELSLARVLDAFAAADPGGTTGAVLVLDDYHLIREPAIHRLVAALLERLPAGARLAIATRADPALPLARLRARGELVEVRGEQLRFTASEAGDLLRSAGVELADPEVEELARRTEGWAAALRLAAVSLRGRPNQAELVGRFGASHRFVLDYVLDEVLAGLPLDTQDFLLRSSILDRLSGPLCDAVTGGTDGQRRLEELERANLLIIPLDDERRWYRYHALFADILRARLGVLHPDEVSELHARASGWHEERADDDEAVHHALQSGELERMERVVANACGRHVRAGELSTVRRWLDALPPGVVRNHAQLSAAYAWYLVIVGETDGVADLLADSERALDGGRDGGPMIRVGVPPQLAMLRAYVALLEGDAATAVAEAERALVLVPDDMDPEAVATLRGTAGALLGSALRRAGDLERASVAYEAALPDLHVGGNVLAAARAISELASIAIARGDPYHAVDVCEAELARNDRGTSSASDGAVWYGIARARAALGQAELADAAARRALELATRSGDAVTVREAREVLAEVAQMPGGGRVVVRRAGDDGPVESLTPREIEVLRLVALGRSNRQIADELFVSVGTVKSHVNSISGKLGAANRVEAVARGRDVGLLG